MKGKKTFTKAEKLYQESYELGLKEKQRLADLGITLEKPEEGIITISIEELMANECS